METNVLIIKNESLERFLIENFNVDAREIRGCTSYYHLMKNEIALKKSDMPKTRHAGVLRGICRHTYRTAVYFSDEPSCPRG